MDFRDQRHARFGAGNEEAFDSSSTVHPAFHNRKMQVYLFPESIYFLKLRTICSINH